MASYVLFTNSFKQDEVMSAYSGLLADIEVCIKMLEELESERSYTGWIFDWVIGKRSSRNIYTNNLKHLYGEIEKGLKLHTNLFFLLTQAELIQHALKLRFKELEYTEMDCSPLMKSYEKISRTNEEFSNRLTIATDKLKDSGIFDIKNIEMGNKLGVLSNTPPDTRVKIEFGSHHILLIEIIKRLENNIDIYEREVKRDQHLILAKNSSLPTPGILNDGLDASRIYDKYHQENLESLRETEPFMTEETRKRMATQFAETACKTFLKEKLNYSNKEVNEFLEKII